MYKIEKNIPVVDKTKRNENKYPFDNMDINGSFYVRLSDTSCKNIYTLRSTLTGTISRYTKQNPNTKFKTSSDEFGIRVWRIK